MIFEVQKKIDLNQLIEYYFDYDFKNKKSCESNEYLFVI